MTIKAKIIKPFMFKLSGLGTKLATDGKKEYFITAISFYSRQIKYQINDRFWMSNSISSYYLLPLDLQKSFSWNYIHSTLNNLEKQIGFFFIKSMLSEMTTFSKDFNLEDLDKAYEEVRNTFICDQVLEK